MNTFLQKYENDITGVLQGFDRLLIRGTLQTLMYTAGILGFLGKIGVLVKDFGAYAERTTERLKKASLEKARQLERPIKYIRDSETSKEDTARRIAAEDGITEGLICVLTAVERCTSYEIHKNPETGQRELKSSPCKCLHLYH